MIIDDIFSIGSAYICTIKDANGDEIVTNYIVNQDDEYATFADAYAIISAMTGISEYVEE